MKVLLTGASGFVASYLIPELLAAGHELVLTAAHPRPMSFALENIPYFECDITQPSEVGKLIDATQPGVIAHLGAVSHVGSADNDRSLLSSVNVVGTHNLCAAASSRGKTRIFLFASTALVYGGSQSQSACSESTPPHPVNAYGMSKLAAEYVVRSFGTDQFKTYIVRPFNHIGPGQSTDFVCSAFAKRVHDAPNASVIPVGNLDAQRDFSDVRDIVKAYRRIIEIAPRENLFVLGRGETCTIRSILDFLVEQSGKDLTVQVNEGLLRSNDDQVKFADCSLAREVLGWRPQISLHQSLQDIYRSIDT